MPSSLAPSQWSDSVPSPLARDRALGQSAMIFTEHGASPVLRWVMKRNCSLSPAQMMAVYLGLCAVSLVIATGFFAQGAPLILAFAGLELLLVGAALLAYARHAGDREVITLTECQVQVEQVDGPATMTAEFRSDRLVIEPVAGQGSLIEFSAHGQRVQVGRFVRPELRAELANDIRRALRRASLLAAPLHSGTEPKYVR